MAKKKSEPANVRKIQRQANGSTTVVLPADIVRELGWKDGQKVVVRKRGISVAIEQLKK
jgi:antitoxin component of MazEF toxin-antitoxin module